MTPHPDLSAAQVELSLSIRCMSEGTLDVTSNDFLLDPQHPDVCPVGALRPYCCLGRFMGRPE